MKDFYEIIVFLFFICSGQIPGLMLIILSALASFGLFRLARATLTSSEPAMEFTRWFELALFLGAALGFGFLLVAAQARSKEKQALQEHDTLQAELTRQQQLTANNEKDEVPTVFRLPTARFYAAC